MVRGREVRVGAVVGMGVRIVRRLVLKGEEGEWVDVLGGKFGVVIEVGMTRW